MSEVGPAEPRLDFFVSHAGSDEDWAKWLAQQLQNAGYTVELDVWNWSAGIDVIQVTQRALDRAARMLAVWTPEYFTRRWADMEHRAAVARSQLQPGWLLPVVVRACPDEVIPVLYRTLIRVELVGLSEVEAREKLLAAVEGPTSPTRRQPYPGEGERDAYPGRLPPIWNVPNRNPFFIGREAELDQLAGYLSAPGTAAAVAGREGIGGVGKSELAVEYAWRHAGEYRMVWWMDAGHQAGAEANLAELAALLDVPASGGTLVAALRAELDRRSDWLLIVDNVHDRDRLDAVLPARSGRVIVTSRDDDVLPAARPVVVGPFSRAESVRLLRRRCSWLSQQAADRIAAIVEDLPVAVAQAAQFLARTAMAADEYLPRLIEQVASGPERGADAGLAATVALAQERLLELDPAAADLLDQLALLADEPMPLTAAAVDVPGAVAAPGLVVSDPETTSELVSSICGLGLAVRVGTHIQLQARVRPLIAGALTEQRLKLTLGRVLRLLATADPGDPAVSANWPLYTAIAPHVEAATAWLPDAAGITEPRSFQRLLDHICQYLRLAGRPGDGYRLADAAHRRRRTTHGDDDPQTLRWAVNRGAALAAMGRHQQAKVVLEDAIERQRRRAGADHPDTLHAAGRLGVTLTALGEYEAAR
ncbi:MAG TPA: FxSxx-COOH system tetratricopeptide repeat protein, partial [Pseudonocardiaceae bacterium]|nr:FxSxx-COOH system tetratricopeptide repeat protein [Pseudonocardiaceae bacterium]